MNEITPPFTQGRRFRPLNKKTAATLLTNWRRGFTIISVNKDFSGRQGYHMDTDCCREAVETLQAGQQAMSKPRHNLMQFHRHAKLKLERWQKNEYSPHFRRKKAKLPKKAGQNRVNCCCSIFDFFKEKNSSRAAFLFFVKKGSDGMDASGSNSLSPRLCKYGSHSVSYADIFGVK